MAGFPVLSTMRGRPVSDLYAVPHLTNYAGVVDSDTLVPSLGRNVARENSLSSFSHADNTEFQEQYGGEIIVSGASRNNFQEHLNDFVHPFDITRTHAGYSSALNLAFATSMNCGYDEVVGNVNLRWDFDKFPISPELGGKSLDPSGWISSNNVDHLFGSSMFNDQNSLRLAPSQSSVSRTSNVLDQFSEMSCSAVTHHCLNETGLGAEQNSCSSKELSLSFGSQNPPNPTQATPGSIYLQIVQEILSQIASYTLENLDLTGYYNGELRTGLNLEYSSSCPADRSSFSFVDPELQKQAVESKKAQLMTLLQVVDDQYNQCIDEIHTVVSAFHAATELDPKKHASFALRTVSFLYKNLRQRISSQILSIGADSYSKGRKSDMSFEASFIQKQWSLQQQKRKEQQLWRPQRGLPEKSVSVLRAWMFQNFLHPYPKDAEKHLLAVKSGLSRNQVSNWFINARVRLWKPMIEEMYSELNKRKACDDQ